MLASQTAYEDLGFLFLFISANTYRHGEMSSWSLLSMTQQWPRQRRTLPGLWQKEASTGQTQRLPVTIDIGFPPWGFGSQQRGILQS